MTIVDCAKKYVGYLEHKDDNLLGVYKTNVGKGGYTIFSESISRLYRFRSFQGLPWCATFVHAVFIEALGKTDARKLFGTPHPGTRVMYRRMRRKRRLIKKTGTPKPGDIIFMSNDRNDVISHVGIVISVAENYITTIEGNTTDPSGVLDKEDGGAVAIRERALDDPTIVCYADTTLTKES